LANKGGIITGAGNRIETDLSEKVPWILSSVIALPWRTYHLRVILMV
jgi:hypothetical protein